MERSIAVTGATGFIGRNLLTLLPAGMRVKALVRPARLKAFRRLFPKVEWVVGDLSSPQALEKLVAGTEAVIHLAGAIRGTSYEDFAATNLKGFLNLVAAASRAGVKRFLYVSSLAARHPYLSPYAATKRQAEDLLRQSPLRWQVFRPPAVYGPYDEGLTPLIKLMLKGVLPVPGDPENRFSLIYVFDLCQAILSWLEKDLEACKIYELHDGRPGGYSWLEVREIVARITGKTPRLVVVPENILRMAGYGSLLASKIIGKAPLFSHYKVSELCHPDWTCDNEEITKDLGWQPCWPLEKALEEWVTNETGRNL